MSQKEQRLAMWTMKVPVKAVGRMRGCQRCGQGSVADWWMTPGRTGSRHSDGERRCENRCDRQVTTIKGKKKCEGGSVLWTYQSR